MGIIEVLFDGTDLDVVMPYAGSGDLFQMLQDSQERGTGFAEAEARYWFRQLIGGVRHLRECDTAKSTTFRGFFLTALPNRKVCHN
jgi:serine/threonine protein kinase